MKIRPYIFAGIGGNPLKTYYIRDGFAVIETFPGGKNSISLSGADISHEKSFKSFLGIGTIKITSTGGTVQEWTHVPNVKKVYEALMRASQGLPPEENESKKPNSNESKLETAKKTHKTDFGNYEDNSVSIEDTKIETPIGTYILHHNGTFTDVENKLMWIQAPWGMTYDGKNFKGEYINLSWDDATKLFGYGGRICELTGGLGISLIKEHLPLEYKRGNCEVQFAGCNDWRLPTAQEILNLCFYYTPENHWESVEEKYDGYHTNLDSKSMELWDNLFPTLSNKLLSYWSANDRGGSEAWLFDDNGSRTLGDYFKSTKCPILFVRNINF